MGHAAGDRGAQGAGARARPVEPVPSADPRRRRRADQPAVRAAGGDHRPQPMDGSGGDQLLGARHREHGAALAVRHGGAEGALAGSAPGRADPVGVLHDRARRRLVGCDEHRHADRARRRRLRAQRAQVVDVGRDVAAVRAPDRHGGHRPRRRAAPAPEHDPRAAGHAGCPRRPLDEPVRVRRRAARRPRRDRLRRCARAGGEPARRRRRGLPARAGAARAGPHPPRDARDRDGRARAGDDVPADRLAVDVRAPDHRPRRRPALDLRGAGEDRAGAPARAQDRVVDGHRRQPRGPDRGVGDQGRRPRGRHLGDRSRDPGARRRRRLAGPPARRAVCGRPHPADRRRARRGASHGHRPARDPALPRAGR